MPHVPIIMPQLGESIAEATVIKLLVKPGDAVREDQEVMEVETSKATTTVNSPCAGTIERITVELNEAYPVGAQLGFITVTDAVAAEMGLGRRRHARSGLADGEDDDPSAALRGEVRRKHDLRPAGADSGPEDAFELGSHRTCIAAIVLTF